MKTYATEKFVIIGIIIIIMIVSYIYKIRGAGNNEPFWVTPSTCGKYTYILGIWGTSIGKLWYIYMCIGQTGFRVKA